MTATDDTTSTLGRQEFHPVAEFFPLMGVTEFEELVQDIKANGLLEPIWRFNGKIIDGRNRWRACNVAGVEHRFREWEGEEKDLTQFVISMNLHRRHLIAANLANTKDGGDRTSEQSANLRSADISAEKAAKLLNVSERSVDSARKIRASAAPEVVAAVESGEITVNAASHLIDMPKQKQVETLAGGKVAITAVRKAAWNKRNRKNMAKEATTPKEPSEGAAGEPKVIGIGIARANEAINSLTRIPKNDALRKRGFQLVTDWIRNNK